MQISASSGDDIYNLLVNEIENKSEQLPEKYSQNTLSNLHDILLLQDDTKYRPVTPHVVLRPSKIKPYIGRRKWVTPATINQSRSSASINLLNGQLRHSLSQLPKHFVDQRSVDDAIVDQGTIEQIPIYNHHRYIEQRMSESKESSESHIPSITALVESFMDLIEDLATSHYYNDNYYNKTGLYYNMLYDTTDSMKRFYNNAVSLYQYIFGNSTKKEEIKRQRQKFLKKLFKWFANQNVQSQIDITKAEEIKPKEPECEFKYDAKSFICLRLAIYQLYNSLQVAKQSKIGKEPTVHRFEVLKSLPHSFTLQDALVFLCFIQERTSTIEKLLTQIPDHLLYMIQARIVQRAMVRKLLQNILSSTKQGKENIDIPIEIYIRSVRPELERRSAILWYMHVMIQCSNKEQRLWMKKLLIAHIHSDLLRNVLTFFEKNISEKVKHLTVVDRQVFCTAWMEKCCPEHSRLARRVALRLLH